MKHAMLLDAGPPSRGNGTLLCLLDHQIYTGVLPQECMGIKICTCSAQIFASRIYAIIMCVT